MQTNDMAFFEALEAQFNRAMVSNDVDQIAQCITEDWVLVTPEVGPVSREAMLDAIRQGRLSHDTMTKSLARVAVYGDMAIVTGRGRNTGQFQGQAISADEWITDVYKRFDSGWKCVLTHLTPAAA
ncbi:hypothetical protein H010_15415 [Hydrogenophaga taeniospiralis CCUG 15921]|uniref:DUF4440 domain-containing protein n=1 Tax=Hydrogenophaga taeniospiralis CCUG 15921 TaxID=1281780 RepID=A0A9X4NUM1_9BURK|nr:nuclear transport factor 2 family protein [Hydrogenophaga taeniospiralis]MDG5976656.1 hypothetical protein [Hydrogenophaga taeniospiralis CCUG 15921]